MNISRQGGRRFKGPDGSYVSAHTHHYSQHPHWETNVYCVHCGMAIPKRLAVIAVKSGATIDEGVI